MLINHYAFRILLKKELCITCEQTVNKLHLPVKRLWVISSKNFITGPVNNASDF
jgi:hypothetical protein